jgi:hypothetical protein
MANFKSDLFGLRKVSKWILLNRRELQVWISTLKTPASYSQVLAALKSIHRDLSVHSLRRGALTRLATCGVPMPSLALLSLHTPDKDPTIAVRRYVDVHPTQPEPQEIIALTNMLQQFWNF